VRVVGTFARWNVGEWQVTRGKWPVAGGESRMPGGSPANFEILKAEKDIFLKTNGRRWCIKSEGGIWVEIDPRINQCDSNAPWQVVGKNGTRRRWSVGSGQWSVKIIRTLEMITGSLIPNS
jgi:hypothetical protein